MPEKREQAIVYDAPRCCLKAADLTGFPMKQWLLWRLPLGLALVGWLAGPRRWFIWSVALLWMGTACVINAKRCRRVHCTFTGPLYALLGLAALARATGWVGITAGWLWALAVGGTMVAFTPEWLGRRYWSSAETGSKDPVCGAWVHGRYPGVTTAYQGQLIHFCSLECKEQFLESPERYLPQRKQEAASGCCG